MYSYTVYLTPSKNTECNVLQYYSTLSLSSRSNACWELHQGTTILTSVHVSCRYGRRSLWCSVFWLTFFAVALSLGGIFSVRYAAPSDNSNSKDLAPNETRIVTYSYAFCKSITVSTASYIIEPGTIYILSRAPALDSEDSFTFNEQPLFAGSNTHHHWNFYLYPGSTLNVSACRSSAAFFDFNYYLIKGKDNFNSWVDNPRSSIAKQFFTISNLCSSGTKQQIPIYSVEEEGEYYMAFFHDTTYAETETLDIDFDISRTKYTVDPDAVLSNCSVSDFDKQCTVDVPLSYGIALLT